MRSVFVALALLVALALGAFAQVAPPPPNCMECGRELGMMYFERRGGAFCSKECAEDFLKRPPSPEQLEAERKAAAEDARRVAEAKAAAEAKEKRKRNVAIGISVGVLALLVTGFVVSAKASAPAPRPAGPPQFRGPRP